MTNSFTPRAQKVLWLARKEADHYHRNFVGTEHLLLGLLVLGQGVAVTVLKKLGLETETVRKEIEKEAPIGPGPVMPGNIPYTPRVQKVLSVAVRDAKALDHTFVGTEHILLGLLGESDGLSAHVFKAFNINREEVRREILRELDPGGTRKTE